MGGPKTLLGIGTLPGRSSTHGYGVGLVWVE